MSFNKHKSGNLNIYKYMLGKHNFYMCDTFWECFKAQICVSLESGEPLYLEANMVNLTNLLSFV